ncbi:MAG: hypothetical protein ACFE8L_06655 [Candidatus Hodarchaeota archaeon]
MEKQREKPEVVPKELKEKAEKELEELRNELARLRKLKKEKEQLEQRQSKEEVVVEQNEELETKNVEVDALKYLEDSFEKIEDLLSSNLGEIDHKAFKQQAKQIESELQILEEEIVGEEGLVVKELSPYEQLLHVYPWLEEERKKFMYTMPNKKKNQTDYTSWKTEWAKVLFDYARFAVLHILYIRNLNSEKPFSNFTNREPYIREIAEELVNRNQAKWLSKKKIQLRVYWKSLELFSDEIYEWAYQQGRLEPIMIYEIREAKSEDFSNLPLEDLEEIFRILVKNRKAKIFKLEDGQIAFKITLE